METGDLETSMLCSSSTVLINTYRGRLSVRGIPRWSPLRHFDNVTDPDAVYDGDHGADIPRAARFSMSSGTILTALQTIFPCIINLLPRNNPLVQDARAHQGVCITLGLRLMSTRLREAFKTFHRGV